MRCPNCGKSVKDSCKFCPNCGYQLNSPHSHDLIVIGNGFDMFLGLSSSFKQFFGINIPDGTYDKLNDIIQQFLNYAKDFGKNYVINGDHGRKIKVTPTLLMEYVDVRIIRRLQKSKDNRFRYRTFHLGKSEIDQLNNYLIDFSKNINAIYSEITNTIDINFWAVYLILREHTNDPYWSSVESEIYNFLTNSNLDFRAIANGLFNIIKISGFSSYEKVTHENSNPLPPFDVYLIIYLILRHIKTNKNLFLNLCNNILKNDISYHKLYLYMCNFFNKELSKFEYDLDCYLYRMCFSEYYKNYGFDYSYVSKQLLACISSGNEFSLINFNYTNPYTKHDLTKSVIKSNEKDLDLVNIRRNIHGRLIPKNDYKKNKGYYSRQSPVIGISDEDIGITDPKYVFTKNYKIMRLSCNHYNNVFQDKKYIKNIKFFGQSFAPADYSYFFSIFDKFDILHSNVKLIFYYANHNGKSDDDCARSQMNKIDSLFFNYCRERTSINDVNYWSRRSKEIIHALSFEGRLIVSNLRDKVDGLNNSDSYIYPKLHKAIFRINNINTLAVTINFKSVVGDFKEISNLNKVINIKNGYFTHDEYQKFMACYHLWKSAKGIKKNKYIKVVNKHALNILKNLRTKWSNKIEGISVNN